jgi:transcriptional regulator with XRE-family HTH domain
MIAFQMSQNRTMKPLAQRLVLSRIDLDITQGELAQRAGISQSYLSRIERGRISDVAMATVEALARALGVRPEYLAGWSEDALGEDLPANVAEGRVVYDAVSPSERRRVQEVVDIMHDLPADRQELAVRVLEEFRNAQRVRIVGE